MLLAGSSALADVKAGVDAWARGDYKTAIAEWKGPADRGDADAQFNLAQAYKLGRGVPQDLAKAEALFGKASAQGHTQASDNYGLLMFQRGDRERAMPYIMAASRRGDPRSQYILGLAHFNGDGVSKDWVRAYALVSLAQQAGLPQAISALAEMNQHIPLEQRQQSIELATRMASEAQAIRSSQVAAADLGSGTMRPAGSSGVSTSMSSTAVGAAPAIPRMPVIATAQKQLAEATPPAPPSPATAGADYARPAAPVGAPPRVAASPAAAAPARPAPTAAPVSSSGGPWRVQLGAFGVAGNAENLWNRVKGRPELSGHARLLVPAGRVTKLQADGFASRNDAQTACLRLSAAGFDCLAVRD